MTDRDEILRIIRENYKYLSSEFGVKKIGIFGSTTKGAATKESDIDILVEFSRPIGFKFVRLVTYLEQILGGEVDVITKYGLNNIRIKRVADNIRASLVYV